MRLWFALPVCLCALGCAARVLETEDSTRRDSLTSGGTRYGGSPKMAMGGGQVPMSDRPEGGATHGVSTGGRSSASNDPGGRSGVSTGGSSGANTGNGGSCLPGQWIMASEVINARDLGGVPLNGGAISACGKLYRGGPLSNLSELGCQELSQLGIRTVIDLRIEGERSSVPDSPCVFAQAQVIDAPLPVPYSLSQLQYLDILNTYESIALAFDVLGDTSAYPIYFHCTYGRDRTGVLAAVILLALGATRDDVYADYLLTAETGLYLPPDSLTAVLDDIEQRGGIGAYYIEAGIHYANVAHLRTSMRVQ